MLNLFWISLIIVYIIDLSGFVEEISERIWKWLYPKVNYQGWTIPKPFSCSLCSTWWIGIIYLLITGTFSFPLLAYVAGLSFLTPVMAKALAFFKDLLDKILEMLWKLIN